MTDPRTLAAEALAESLGVEFQSLQWHAMRYLGLHADELRDYASDGWREANRYELSRFWDWDDESGTYVEQT